MIQIGSESYKLVQTRSLLFQIVNTCVTGCLPYRIANTFVDGDKLTLKATGYLDGAKTASAVIDLAEFSAQKDSIVSTWTRFDLGALGNVDYVDFDVISTKEDMPAYFCLDGFIASVTISY